MSGNAAPPRGLLAILACPDERRENRRDAFGRIVAFLRRHGLDEPKEEPDPWERS